MIIIIIIIIVISTEANSLSLLPMQACGSDRHVSLLSVTEPSNKMSINSCLALYRGLIVALWHCIGVTRSQGGTATLYRGLKAALWHCNEVSKWHCGTVSRSQGGTVALY